MTDGSGHAVASDYLDIAASYSEKPHIRKASTQGPGEVTPPGALALLYSAWADLRGKPLYHRCGRFVDMNSCRTLRESPRFKIVVLSTDIEVTP
jgi:hypothetical protein